MSGHYPDAKEVLNELISGVGCLHQESLSDEDLNLREEKLDLGEDWDYRGHQRKVAICEFHAGTKSDRRKFIVQVIMISDNNP